MTNQKNDVAGSGSVCFSPAKGSHTPMLHQPKTNREEDAMRYHGPAKPIPTAREIITDRAEATAFALLAVFLAVFLYLE